MPALRVEGYVIVSSDGMLADQRNVMPGQLPLQAFEPGRIVGNA